MVNPMDQQQIAGRIGQVIKDTYRLTRIIGKGGMGEVYEAEHVSLPRRFAVKFLLGDLGLGDEVLARFHREASIAASVGSKHIVEVFDYGQTADGGYFMVMEYLEGETLTQRIKSQGAMEPQAWLRLFSQLAVGLEAAHAENVVHRDLKPDNVFLARDKRGEEVLKILDFGISKIRTSGVGVTQAGAVMGTPSYMPPEQAEGATAETDARADVFSLGAIVYEVLTGKVAFEGPTIPATILKVCYQEPDPLETVAPHLPPAVIAVVMRALRKAPGDRYQSVAEFYDAYRAALGLAPSTTLPNAATAAMRIPLAPTLATSGGQGDSTLSAAAAELQPSDLPVVAQRGGGGRGAVIAVVVVAALAIIGGGTWFFAFRGSGDNAPKAGATKPASDAGATPASGGSNTNDTSPPAVKGTPPDAFLPAVTPDAAASPRTPPRRVATPERPRPRPMEPMARVRPRRTPPRRRPPRRRTSKWAQ
jgi:serine/threonine-protein kinase